MADHRHGLMGEGAPHHTETDANGHTTVHRTSYLTVGGGGRGLCTCGAFSGVLRSGASRKRWHSKHKYRMANGNHDG